MKKILALVFLAMFGLTIAGCHTLYRGCKGAKDGAKEDWQDSCTGLQGADNWVKKNLW